MMLDFSETLPFFLKTQFLAQDGRETDLNPAGAETSCLATEVAFWCMDCDVQST